MTAIDTSKLKEGMRVEYDYTDITNKKRAKSGTLFLDNEDNWCCKETSQYIIMSDGNLHRTISNVRFPDLQEQDRVEQPILFRNCGQRDEGKFVMKLREWYVIDMGEYLTTVHEKDIIHETKLDLDLKELLLKLNCNLTPHGIDRYSAEIKSLLAAKVPPTYMEIHNYIDKKIAEGSAPKYAGFQAVLHFTKNETK